MVWGSWEERKKHGYGVDLPEDGWGEFRLADREITDGRSAAAARERLANITETLLPLEADIHELEEQGSRLDAKCFPDQTERVTKQLRTLTFRREVLRQSQAAYRKRLADYDERVKERAAADAATQDAESARLADAVAERVQSDPSFRERFLERLGKSGT